MKLDNVHANLELKELYVTDASLITLTLVIPTDVNCAIAGRMDNLKPKMFLYLFLSIIFVMKVFINLVRHRFDLNVTWKQANVNVNLEFQVKSVKDVILGFGIYKQMVIKIS